MDLELDSVFLELAMSAIQYITSTNTRLYQRDQHMLVKCSEYKIAKLLKV